MTPEQVRAWFQAHVDWPTFARMIRFFSVPGKYLHLNELKEFYDSMNQSDWVDFKVEFWDYVVENRESPWYSVLKMRDVDIPNP